MKLHNMRGPNWVEASVSATIVIEKTTPTTMIMETPNVPHTLRLLDPTKTEGPISVDGASYYLSKIELKKGTAPTTAAWRKRLFIATSYITADAAEYFGLPGERTVIMGSRIEV